MLINMDLISQLVKLIKDFFLKIKKSIYSINDFGPYVVALIFLGLAFLVVDPTAIFGRKNEDFTEEPVTPEEPVTQEEPVTEEEPVTLEEPLDDSVQAASSCDLNPSSVKVEYQSLN